MDNTEAMVTLSLTSGLGCRNILKLVKHFGKPQSILSANQADLREIRGIGPKIISELGHPHIDEAKKVIAQCQDAGIQIITLVDPCYPSALLEIPDPPSVLYVQGNLTPDDSKSIAIVGTRRCTSYGLTQAERLARELAEMGITVISGLARGIDGAAHNGALETGGRTVAVLGSGLLSIYPPEHQGLARRIVQQGAVLSEFLPSMEPFSYNFPKRNRIISGLALGVVIVEAGEKSGALITAELALEQGKEVFAVPGRINNPSSQGTLKLIQEGAKLVRNLEDILEEFPSMSTNLKSKESQTLTPQEHAIMKCLDDQPQPIDQIIEESHLPASTVSGLILLLETKGFVRFSSGEGYIRVRIDNSSYAGLQN